MLRLNIGCGQSPTLGWINFDNSFAIRMRWVPFILLKHLTFLGASRIENIKWVKNNAVEYFDARKPIKFNDNSVDVIYTSHMLEHMSREDALVFLRNTYRILKPGGVLRISVPDLSILIKRYLDNHDGDAFMEEMMVAPPRLNSFFDFFKVLINGYRHHQWMYNEVSLKNALQEIGFSRLEKMDPGETHIKDPGDLNLYERSGNSLYIEAIK